MRTLLNLIVYSLTIIVIAVVGGGYWVVHEYKKPGPLDQNTIFTVERGQSASDIAGNLESQNIIEDALVFRIGLKFLDDNRFLKAGEYRLEPNMSMQEVVATMQSGQTIEYQFTIPECTTSFEVMNILNDIDILTGELLTPPLEGTIYPDTYNYIRGESRDNVLLRMQGIMDTMLEATWRLRKTNNKHLKTPQDALILASIVEKEAGNPEERRRVAGLFLNRLDKGMRLQSDPTVIYGIVDGRPKTDGMGPLGRRILRKDLEFDSPYNTYIYPGLPPGPICNPGKASLEAVLDPEEHDYIYMVADGSGGHAFAVTLRDHNNNVNKWRKIRAAQ